MNILCGYDTENKPILWSLTDIPHIALHIDNDKVFSFVSDLKTRVTDGEGVFMRFEADADTAATDVTKTFFIRKLVKSRLLEQDKSNNPIILFIEHPDWLSLEELNQALRLGRSKNIHCILVNFTDSSSNASYLNQCAGDVVVDNVNNVTLVVR